MDIREDQCGTFQGRHFCLVSMMKWPWELKPDFCGQVAVRVCVWFFIEVCLMAPN